VQLLISLIIGVYFYHSCSSLYRDTRVMILVGVTFVHNETIFQNRLFSNSHRKSVCRLDH
jgi:hypothetical protein